VGIAVSPVGEGNVEIAAGAIADVVNEFVRTALVVFVGMAAVLGVREGEVALTRLFELGLLMDEVLG
jgi:hypothetical protein